MPGMTNAETAYRRRLALWMFALVAPPLRDRDPGFFVVQHAAEIVAHGPPSCLPPPSCTEDADCVEPCGENIKRAMCVPFEPPNPGRHCTCLLFDDRRAMPAELAFNRKQQVDPCPKGGIWHTCRLSLSLADGGIADGNPGGCRLHPVRVCLQPHQAQHKLGGAFTTPRWPTATPPTSTGFTISNVPQAWTRGQSPGSAREMEVPHATTID